MMIDNAHNISNLQVVTMYIFHLVTLIKTVFKKEQSLLLDFVLLTAAQMFQNWFSRRCSNKTGLLCACSQWILVLYVLSGSHFKEAEKGKKVSVDFRIHYFKGNQCFGCYIVFIKHFEGAQTVVFLQISSNVGKLSIFCMPHGYWSFRVFFHKTHSIIVIEWQLYEVVLFLYILQ